MKTKMHQLPFFLDFTTTESANYMKTLRGPYSQAEFAGVLGTDASVVDNWERGVSRPRPGHMRAALEHYQRWAIQQELPSVARAAMDAAGIKKSLTRPTTHATRTENTAPSPADTPPERSAPDASSSRSHD